MYLFLFSLLDMRKRFLVFTGLLLMLSACGNKQTGAGFNLFTIEQDRQLGAQVAAEIESNPQEYPILDSASNIQAYRYIYAMRDKLLNSGNVRLKDDFQWRIRIIRDDNTLNAFCTPGGYIYIYTGLIKFLDAEDQLAGVLAHEIAHADFRHSTRQMTRMYGVQMLLSVLAGNREALKQVTGGLIGLKFSRGHEEEADYGSVLYMCPTDYDAAGGATFFEKLEAMGGAQSPQFLSSHPSPTNRIAHFHETKLEKGCNGNQTFASEYAQFKAILP